MKRYCLIRELDGVFRQNYIDIHKNPWPEIPQAIRDCGCNIAIFIQENRAILFFECEDIDAFYRQYNTYEIVKKWNDTVDPWVKKSPCLNGNESVDTLELIFDSNQ